MFLTPLCTDCLSEREGKKKKKQFFFSFSSTKSVWAHFCSEGKPQERDAKTEVSVA